MIVADVELEQKNESMCVLKKENNDDGDAVCHCRLGRLPTGLKNDRLLLYGISPRHA